MLCDLTLVPKYIINIQYTIQISTLTMKHIWCKTPHILCIKVKSRINHSVHPLNVLLGSGHRSRSPVEPLGAFSRGEEEEEKDSLSLSGVWEQRLTNLPLSECLVWLRFIIETGYNVNTEIDFLSSIILEYFSFSIRNS